MNHKHTGKRLLETFLDGGIPPVALPETVNAHKVKFNPPPVANPRKDIPVPENLSSMPIDERGYLVPYFVAWVDGKPDFRCVRPGAITECVQKRLCWLCGKPHDRDPSGHITQTYVIGTMCSINHISAEPGSHFECARYAVQVCPFLTAPNMRRNEKNLPEDTTNPGGRFIKRNPVCTLLWTTPRFTLVPDGNAVLFRLGNPTRLEAWREGRYASMNEVMEAIDSGIPLLQAEADAQGPKAQAALDAMRTEAIRLLRRFI